MTLLQYGNFQGNGFIEFHLETANQVAPIPLVNLSLPVPIIMNDQIQRMIGAASIPESAPNVPTIRQTSVKMTAVATLNTIRKGVSCTFQIPHSAPDEIMLSVESSNVHVHLYLNRSKLVSICMRFAVFSSLPPQVFTAQV